MTWWRRVEVVAVALLVSLKSIITFGVCVYKYWWLTVGHHGGLQHLPGPWLAVGPHLARVGTHPAVHGALLSGARRSEGSGRGGTPPALLLLLLHAGTGTTRSHQSWRVWGGEERREAVRTTAGQTSVGGPPSVMQRDISGRRSRDPELAAEGELLEGCQRVGVAARKTLSPCG